MLFPKYPLSFLHLCIFPRQLATKSLLVCFQTKSIAFINYFYVAVKLDMVMQNNSFYTLEFKILKHYVTDCFFRFIITCISCYYKSSIQTTNTFVLTLTKQHDMLSPSLSHPRVGCARLSGQIDRCGNGGLSFGIIINLDPCCTAES